MARLYVSRLDRLHFSRRARRRAAIKRRIVWASIVSLTAMALGVPGSDAGLQFVLGVAERHAGVLWPEEKAVESTESAAAALRFRARTFETRALPTPRRITSITPDILPTVTPSATPTVQTAPVGSVEDVIYAAAAEFGLDGGYLLSVAVCESGLDPNAYNPAGYHGLFQFDQTTWAGNGYGSIYDPVAQARTAARLLAAGEASRWPNCA